MSENDGFDMDSLRKRMERQENQYVKLVEEQSKYTSQEFPLPEYVHIILFLPDTPQQHVHTIEIPKGSGNNVLLVFEKGEDCDLFADMLKDLEFVNPCVSNFCYCLYFVCDILRTSDICFLGSKAGGDRIGTTGRIM